jgi:hypothetical protein
MREAAMDGDRIAKPFHAGELEAQRLAGAAPAAAPIRALMPDQPAIQCALISLKEGLPACSASTSARAAATA